MGISMGPMGFPWEWKSLDSWKWEWEWLGGIGGNEISTFFG